MLNVGLLLNLSLLLLLAGCSFQASRPAPVESLSKHHSKQNKGHIKGESYKVKKGDTLYSISWAVGKDYAEIAKINQLDKSFTIYPGQVLYLTYDHSQNSKASTILGGINSANKGLYQLNSSKKQYVSDDSAVEGLSSEPQKKTLDQKAKPAYSATSSQQRFNSSIVAPTSTLPDSVSQWQWPVRGKLIGTYSANEQGNKGIKIAGKRGDIIKAAADGRVVYAGSALRGYGNLVIIKHSDDYLSAYAHADQILVDEKQHVLAGQTIAKMGSTGTNQVMLRFEIRYHGQSVNPLNYLPKQ
ncbi:peptidoglycan DD-metalloendopeptidase family protein [Shewanella oneidensis MR-1]|uniref:Lipoprotein NlpD n=1 Tax=Shewanella oneidensis (strain ATCC 700550 / JCM 31522 / CIP 106686 / LMG 19005 / NCIMB 14063 / MR-1) TaxID=211586 RepID=Q8EBR7_SHEON|nr:peptidoglycan DD-metalloendopeptidase family protein [Shewanella oneidensis]AAN56430.1 lipoprotein NlpD [Shewanella oneidensis MR-1]MDX5999160.1 peptidoglycan DD-metalloendopeptidase family protein [Shewanella oneidensis]MEE2028321.1 Murein hydrolase activator NlpD [Shewanella oneidensis]QKG97823.1 peptidoglycan DD-metalloendopeptidase family protein [Shewanella oneidensis MR-1]